MSEAVLMNTKKQEEVMSEQIWTEAARVSIASGAVPVPVTDTVLEILKTIMTEEQARFVRIFTKPLNPDEVRERSGLAPESVAGMLRELMRNGIVTGIPSRSSGVMVYRLMPPVPGLFEFTMMRGETGEKQKRLARLFEKLFDEVSGMVQGSYNEAVELLKAAPPVTRVVPVAQEVDPKLDKVIPYEDVGDILNKFELFAVANCYCRHEKELLGKPCEVTREKENCLFFGQIARFVIDHGFGREASKEEVKGILHECEKAGLVHKTFHNKQDVEKDEFAICNCCKCCCATFQLYYRGAIAAHTYASYVARTNGEICTSCEVCVEKCPMEAISIVGDGVSVEESKCIGCGVCASHCPEDAIHLDRTGMREVFVPPARRAPEDTLRPATS
jgi:ferredoxin